MLSFQRAVGAAADAKEIEYCSAIHQATPRPRPDGSITAPDVSYFLLSRYGIKVDEDEVRETIIKGYGGAAAEDECIDISELTCTILIPFLREATEGYEFDGGPPGEASEENSGREKKKEGEVTVSSAGGGEKSSNGDDDGDDDNVVRRVLDMILGDVTGSTDPPVVDRNFVRRVLVAYGEAELARDGALVDAMVTAATGGGRRQGEQRAVLDERAFARAIAGDVRQYEAEAEGETTTGDAGASNVYRDIFPKKGEDRRREVEVISSSNVDTTTSQSAEQEIEVSFEDEEDPQQSGKGTWQHPKEVCTANGIDFISDTHRSKMFVVCLWAYFIMIQWTFLPNPTGEMDPNQWTYLPSSAGECEDADFSCIISRRVVRWIILASSYSIGGTLFITIGSLGNSFETKSPLLSIASILSMVAAVAVPLYLVSTDGINQDWSKDYLATITIAFGVIVVLLQIIYFLGKHLRCLGCCGGKVFAALQTGNVLDSINAKEAETSKTRQIVRNALAVHGSRSPSTGTAATGEEQADDNGMDKSYSRALLNFAKQGESARETCGGLLWTWHYIRTWKLSKVEGVLIPSKLLTANILQLIMSVFVTVVLVLSTGRSAEAVEEFLSDPAYGITVTDEVLANLKSSIRLSGYVGSAVCFVVCIVLTLSYLPSVVRTTLQFRCGDLPSLGDESFFKYTVAPDSSSKVPGSMFWCIFHAGVAVYLLFGGVVFSFAFQGTRKFAYSIVAQIIGFLIPTVFKLIVLIVLRNRFYAGQYRRRPVAANFMGLALQCLDYGLAFGYMLFRAAKLVLIPVYYIGRVDTPVFAPRVGSIGPLELDDSPVHFGKLIIGHEAHRHPYIEILGKMYLLKLKHRDNFATVAGSRWRMIFVSALMPWMRRHRVVFDGGRFTSELDRMFSRARLLSVRRSEWATSEYELMWKSKASKNCSNSAEALSAGTDSTHKHDELSTSTDDKEEERSSDGERIHSLPIIQA